MRTKYVLLLAAFIATVCATVARADIPIIQADTVFQGFGGGSVSGIVFGPTGETVIIMHDAQPIEVDVKTKQVIREFEKVPNALGSETLFLVKDKGWLIDYTHSSNLNGIKDFYGNVIWDINTGKIIHSINGIHLLAETDKNKYYSYIIKGQKQFIGMFDINTFKFIDSIEFDQGWAMGEQTRFSAGFGIIPNSNKVLIGANGANYKGRSKLYVLDFDTKKYTEIPIPFEQNQDSSTILSINTSETGKYFTVKLSLPFDGTAVLIYDKNFKFLKKETYSELNTKVNYPSERISIWEPYFIHDDYIFAIGKYWSSELKDNFYSHDFYDIASREIKKKIAFDGVVFVDYYGNDIALLTKDAKVGLLHLDALPVIDNKTTIQDSQAVFQNGKIILNFETSEKAYIDIIDYEGNVLYTKKEIYFNQGSNLLPIEITLSNGIYFCIVKTNHGNYSYKFMVSR